MKAMDWRRSEWILCTLTLIGCVANMKSDNVRWRYEVRLEVNHTGDKPDILKERATNFTKCVFQCFLESMDLKQINFEWKLQESPAAKGREILTTNSSLMVTCSKNSSDPQTVSKWASLTYSDTSLIDDVCKPQTEFRGLVKHGVDVEFKCAASGISSSCVNGDVCQATCPHGPSAIEPKQEGASKTTTIVGGAVGASVMASALAGLAYFLRKLKKGKIADGTTPSPQGSTTSLGPDIPDAFTERAKTSEFPTRTH